jgi:hypothetical protein
VAVDSEGNVIVGGYSDGPIDFGCGLLQTAAGDTPVLFKLDPAGNCLWSRAFTVPQTGASDQVRTLAVDVTGDIYVAVTFYGSVDLGGGTMTAVGQSDIAVAKYDADGNYQWALQYGDAGIQIAFGIALDPSGNVLVVGAYTGALDFGGGALTASGGLDGFIAKLTPAGAYVWAHAYGSSGNHEILAVASDPSGNVLVTGENLSTMDFGCGALTSAGLSDVFIAKLTPAGACLWSKGYGDSANQTGNGIASNANGDVIATGLVDGTMEFDGTSSTSYTSLAGDDAWVLALDPSGKYLWSATVGGPDNQNGLGVSVDSAGNVLMAGVLAGSAVVGGQTLTSVSDSEDILVVKYDPGGNLLWAHTYGDPSLQFARIGAFDAEGNVALTGVTNGPIDFGFGTAPVAGFGGEDIFVFKLGP